MRPRVRVVLSSTLLVGSLVWLSGPQLASASPRVVISPQGLPTVTLGLGQLTVNKRLTQLLGRATLPITPTPLLSQCGVSAMASWHALSVFFNKNRLVGISLGPGGTPGGATSAGLGLRDTWARARTLYHNALHFSTLRGGSWYVKTPSGLIDGLLIPNTGKPPRATSRILTIDVGRVGCPAFSP